MKDKFIAFVDILGYKNLRDSSLAGTGMPFPDLALVRGLLCTSTDRKQFAIDGPTTCPCSRYLSRDLDFLISQEQENDCCLITCEVSPAGVVNLARHCSGLVLRLLQHGVLCRGCITRGLIHHTTTTYDGPGFDEVVEREKRVQSFKRDADDRGTPFVEVDHTVSDYVKSCGDACVIEKFSRLVEDDGESFAVFPFKRLVLPVNLGGFGYHLDIDGEKQSVKNTRAMLIMMKARVKALVDISNRKAVRKSEHYLTALDDQLAICDEYDAFFDELDDPFPSGTLGDIRRRNP